MMLTLRLGTKTDLEWAQATVEQNHYLHQRVDNHARPMVYVIEYCYGENLGLIMAGIPHATRRKNWWGYPDTITQWQVLDLNRIWLSPRIQQGGDLALSHIVPGFRDRKGTFRPTTATWAIKQVLSRIQKDRISWWPPVYLDQPYHIRLVISYHDPKFHEGLIYKLAKARPMDTNDDNEPVPAPSGKYCWYWQLPEPNWTWEDIKILRPRNLRMAFI